MSTRRASVPDRGSRAARPSTAVTCAVEGCVDPSPPVNAGQTTTTIVLAGARGGQGTSTVAAVVAILAGQEHTVTLVACDPAATASILGIPDPADHLPVEISARVRLASTDDGTSEVVVVDAGGDPVPEVERPGSKRYTVLRGPCYVALATILRSPGSMPDGIILVAEEGRALTVKDVEGVLGVPVVATLRVSDRVARSIDAGLLPFRLTRMSELTPLRSLLPHPIDPSRPPHPQHPTSPSRQPRTTTPNTVTVGMDRPAPDRLVRGSPRRWRRSHMTEGADRCRQP